MQLAFLFCVLAVCLARLEPVKDGAPFQWDNCDDPGGNWVKIRSLNVQPDPIKLGGDITIDLNLVIGQVISNTTFNSVSLTLETKTLGVWVEIPCIDGVGSCTYNGQQICGNLANHASSNCPKVQPYNLPCVCPFLPGSYATPAGGITVPTKNPGISWLTNGDFYAKAVVSLTTGEAACVEVYFSLSS